MSGGYSYPPNGGGWKPRMEGAAGVRLYEPGPTSFSPGPRDGGRRSEYEHQDDGADDRAEQAGGAEAVIVAGDQIAQEPADERSGEPENHGPQQAQGVSTWNQQSSDRARDEADDQSPNDVHAASSAVACLVLPGGGGS
jgi:hypothetical protein